MDRPKYLRVFLFFAMIAAMVPALFPVPVRAGERDPLAELERSLRTQHRFVLDNGMICLVKEDHSAPVVAVQIWIRAGAMNEQEFLGGGLSHYVEHMIFKGTAKRGATEITRDIDNTGGSINAYTSLDRTVIHAELPSKSWRVGVDVLADAVMNSTFPESEWEREKNVILREIAMNRDDPGRVLGNMARQAAFTVHPARVPVIGYEDVFKQMTRVELLTYFHRKYRPDNMIAVVAGDIDAGEVETELRKTFADFKRTPAAPEVMPVEPPQVSSRIVRKTGDYNRTRIAVLFHTVPMCHADMPALDVLALVAGQGASSRLTSLLRDKLGLVHSVEAWSYTPLEGGMFGVEMELDPAREAEVLAAVQDEIARWRKGVFTKKEVDKAIRNLTVSQLSSLQSAGGQAGSMASDEFYAGDAAYTLAYLRAIGNVTPAKLREVADRYLAPANSTTAILAPASNAAPDKANVEQSAAAPKARRLLMDNGVPLLVREDHRLPFVYFCAVFKGGLLGENATNAGITKLTATLLTRGAGGKSAAMIANEYESVGADLSSFSGRNSFGLRGRCLSRDADKFSKLFADCLLSPSFPESEVGQWKQIQIGEIERQYESPMFLAQDALSGIIHTNHPYRWTEAGTARSVAGLTRDAICSYYVEHAIAADGNAAIAIFGDISEREAKELAEKRFGRMRKGSAPVCAIRTQSPVLPARIVQTAPREQAIFLAGFPGVDLRDPRADCLSVLDTAMSGLSSDIGVEVREKRGLVYYVGAYQRPGLEPGMFVVYAGARKDTIDEVEKLSMKELERLSSSGLRQEELDRARKQIIAARDMSLQDNGSVAMECALNEIYGLGYDYMFTLEGRMNAITIGKIKDTAASIFATNRLAISIVLPAEKNDKAK